MALGGGTWQTQNKVLPGTYITFSSVAKASATLSDRGYAAAPFALSWGPEGKLFPVTSGEFQKNSKSIFGYGYDHPKLLALREIFQHATTVYCWRLGNGTKAACTLAEARYPGERGNDLSITVAANVDDESAWDVITYLDGQQVDTQTVKAATDLVSNDYVTFKASASLAATTNLKLTSGADDSSITGEDHQAFLAALEAYSFNTLCCPAKDSTTVNLYTKFTQRMRDEVGAKFQLVAWRPNRADYDGVIGVWNTATHPSIPAVDEQAVVYWVTGAQAGVSVNASLTNTAYDGELLIDTNSTQAELEAAIKAGKFIFHDVNGVTRVLDDINTLLTLSDTKGEVFQSNQTMRVCDQIANDMAVLFATRYLGTVPNDASGRSSLWGDAVKLMQQLEQIRAIQDFSSDNVTCEQGDKKKAVLLTISGLNIVNAMAQLYMSVVID